MHDLELIAAAIAATLAVLGGLRLLRRGYQAAGPALQRRVVERSITLDDFEPDEVQADQIRLAVENFDRQRTPATMKPDSRSPGGFTYDYDGPRHDAGRLFGVVWRGEIAMFYQWRGDRSSEPADPVKAALTAFWRDFPEAVDEDGWPERPDKVFEVNPGLYGPVQRQYVPPLDSDQIHPALKTELP